MTLSVTAHQAERWLSAGEAVLIDVREPAELAAGRISRALSIPLGGLAQALPTLRLAPGVKVIFQCASGMRGEQACALAAGLSGYEVFNLEGGIAAWRAAGLPVIGQTGPRLTLFRQVQIVAGSLIATLVAAGFAGFTPAFAVAGMMGMGLAFAGLTGWCGMAKLLARMPWNRATPVAATR